MKVITSLLRSKTLEASQHMYPGKTLWEPLRLWVHPTPLFSHPGLTAPGTQQAWSRLGPLLPADVSPIFHMAASLMSFYLNITYSVRPSMTTVFQTVNCHPSTPFPGYHFSPDPMVEDTICVIVSPTYHQKVSPQRAWISVPCVQSCSCSTENIWPTVSIQYIFVEWKWLIPKLFSVFVQMSPPEGKSDTLILFSPWASPLLVL